MTARWYRLLAGYGSLLGLNVMFLVASLGVVTIPAALTAVYQQSRELAANGESPTWRGFARAMRRHARTATLVGVAFAVPAFAIGLTVTRSASPAVAGVATGAALVLLSYAGLVFYVVGLDVGGVRASLWRTAAAVVVRPGTAVTAAASWLAVAWCCLAVPPTVALPVYLVLVSLPVHLTCVAVERFRPGESGTARPRVLAQRLVLHPPTPRVLGP